MAGLSAPPTGGAGAATAAPLFLNSADKCSADDSPRGSARERRLQIATSAVVLALVRRGNRLHEQSEEAARRGDPAAVQLLVEANMWRCRAAKIEECGKLRSIPYQCANGHRWEVAPMGCGNRLCPRCERKAALYVEERLAFLLGQFENPVRMLTLTLPNYPAGSLTAMLKDMERAFSKLRKSKLWKRNVRGAVAVFECTASEERGWHAHTHVAWDGRFMPWKEVLAAWQKASGGAGQRIDVRGQRCPKAAAVRYLSKYASKGVRVAELPEDMAGEFVETWWRFRTLRTYGVAYKTKFVREKWDGLHRCPTCGEPGAPVPTQVVFVPRVPSPRARAPDRWAC